MKPLKINQIMAFFFLFFFFGISGTIMDNYIIVLGHKQLKVIFIMD